MTSRTKRRRAIVPRRRRRRALNKLRHPTRHAHRHTHAQAHTQTHTDAQRHTQTHTDTHTPTQTHTHTDKHRHAQTHKDTRRHAQTHTDAHRHTQTHCCVMEPQVVLLSFRIMCHQCARMRVHPCVNKSLGHQEYPGRKKEPVRMTTTPVSRPDVDRSLSHAECAAKEHAMRAVQHRADAANYPTRSVG